MTNSLFLRPRLIVLIGLVLVLFLAINPALYAGGKPRVLPPHAHHRGLSYSEWSARWWQWALAIPTDSNPLLEEGEVDCSIGQTGNVWFLGGNIGGTSVRSCTIPSGTSLLFPIVNVIMWRPGDFETEAEGRALGAQIIDTATNLVVQVDSVSVKNLQDYRFQSPLFQFTVPEDNIYGIEAPLTRDGLSDGYWIMLAPLSVGEHYIHFAGEVDFFGTPFALDVTYHITVVPRGQYHP